MNDLFIMSLFNLITLNGYAQEQLLPFSRWLPDIVGQPNLLSNEVHDTATWDQYAVHVHARLNKVCLNQRYSPGKG